MHRALVKKLVTTVHLHYRDSRRQTLLQSLVACSPIQIPYEQSIFE